MSQYTFNLHRGAGYVSVHQGLDLKYRLPYGVDRLTREWTAHALTTLIGKGEAYRVLGSGATVREGIPDKRLQVLIPKEYHIAAKPSLWIRFRNFFTL